MFAAGSVGLAARVTAAPEHKEWKKLGTRVDFSQ